MEGTAAGANDLPITSDVIDQLLNQLRLTGLLLALTGNVETEIDRLQPLYNVIKIAITILQEYAPAATARCHAGHTMPEAVLRAFQARTDYSVMQGPDVHESVSFCLLN